MAWSWSHSQEAYHNLRANIYGQDREWLEVVFAEWRAAQGKHGIINSIHADFSNRKYERALAWAKQQDRDWLAEFIYEQSEQFSTCTNGGWEAWCCPHGCGSHQLPFDLLEDLNLDLVPFDVYVED